MEDWGCKEGQKHIGRLEFPKQDHPDISGPAKLDWSDGVMAAAGLKIAFAIRIRDCCTIRGIPASPVACGRIKGQEGKPLKQLFFA